MGGKVVNLRVTIILIVVLEVCLLLMGNLANAQDEEEGGGSGGEGEPAEPDIGETEGEFVDYAKLSLDKKFLKGSRWDVEKTQLKQKIEVHHAMEILEIDKVNVDTMSIRVFLMLQQRWVADDLTFPTGLFKKGDKEGTFVTASAGILDSIWSPVSIFIASRETAIASFGPPHAIVRIFPNKTIVYRAKLSLALGCKFSFEWYPLDYQRCDLQIESFAFTSRTVRYLWERPEMTQPLTVREISLYQYALRQPLVYSQGATDHWGRKGKYPYVRVEFVFERKIGFNLLQTFIPTNLIIILSWFSFWLGLDAIPARVTLLITCLLAMVTMHASNKSGIPPVNYVKMMDVWMVACMLFVFLALCEFIIVKYLNWRLQQQKKSEEQKPDELVTLILQMQKKLQQGRGAKRTIHPYLEFYGNFGDAKRQDEEYRIALILQENSSSRINDVLRNRFGGPQPPPPPYGPMPMGYPAHMYGNLGPDGPPIPPELLQHYPQEKKQRPLWVEIDRWSRIAFPLAFAIFNCVYWPVLIKQSVVAQETEQEAD